MGEHTYDDIEAEISSGIDYNPQWNKQERIWAAEIRRRLRPSVNPPMRCLCCEEKRGFANIPNLM